MRKKTLVLQRQPNEWSCLPTAFAMMLNLPVEKLIKKLGHDGSEIIIPELEEPYCRKSFHIQELIDFCMQNSVAVIQIEHNPVYEVKRQQYYIKMPYRRMDYYLLNYTGVLTGIGNRGLPHAVAWNGERVYDPNGTIYGISEFSINMFFVMLNYK